MSETLAGLSMDAFLASVEQRAFRMALFATKVEADALDIVQDAMLKLVQNYRDHHADEWPLLFQRIIQRRILDFHRKQTRKYKVFGSPRADDNDAELSDYADAFANPQEDNPANLLAQTQDVGRVLAAIESLPIRQQQAFLLRAWEGFSVATTAELMQCTEGSVKTHYFRAMSHLRKTLEAANA